MLNFIAVAYGSSQDTLEFCERIRRLFREKLCNGDALIYDREFLCDPRFKVGILDSNSRFAFTLKPAGFKKEYLGFFKDGYSDVGGIRDRIFGCADGEFGLFIDTVPEYEYSELRLFSEIDGHFNCDRAENADAGIDADFEIEFELTKLELDCFYAHARISFDAERIKTRTDEFLDWFRYVVRFCDVNFGSCFHSAYISPNPKGLEIAHASVFSQYDKADLENRILGCEWYGYFCNRIAEKTGESSFADLSSVATLEDYPNGISYTLKMPICDYISRDSLYLYELFGDSLVSGVSHWRWADFVCSKRRLYYPIDRFNVYQDMLGDKHLLFIYKCTPRKLSSLVNLDYRTIYKSYRHYHY